MLLSLAVSEKQVQVGEERTWRLKVWDMGRSLTDAPVPHPHISTGQQRVARKVSVPRGVGGQGLPGLLVHGSIGRPDRSSESETNGPVPLSRPDLRVRAEKLTLAEHHPLLPDFRLGHKWPAGFTPHVRESLLGVLAA